MWLDVAYHIHRELGPGLLESVYEAVMAYELRKRGLHVAQQLPVPVVWDELKLDTGFRMDLLVDHRVIVELKSVEVLPRVAKKTLLTHLRLADMRLGLLINFGEELIKHGISRVVNGLPEE